MQLTSALGLDAPVQTNWLFWGPQLTAPFGGIAIPTIDVKSGIKADPLQLIVLFCIPQLTGPPGVGNVIPAGPVQDS